MDAIDCLRAIVERGCPTRREFECWYCEQDYVIHGHKPNCEYEAAKAYVEAIDSDPLLRRIPWICDQCGTNQIMEIRSHGMPERIPTVCKNCHCQQELVRPPNDIDQNSLTLGNWENPHPGSPMYRPDF
jgi:hypothetical protein